MKASKQAVSRCYICDAPSSEVILDRVKKAPAGTYVCEHCQQEQDRYGYKAIIRKKFGDDLADKFDPYTPGDDEKISEFENDEHEADEE